MKKLILDYSKFWFLGRVKVGNKTIKPKSIIRSEENEKVTLHYIDIDIVDEITKDEYKYLSKIQFWGNIHKTALTIFASISALAFAIAMFGDNITYVMEWIEWLF